MASIGQKIYLNLKKTYDEDSNRVYFLEADIEYPKKIFSLHSDLPFLPERKFKNVIKLFVTFVRGKTMLFT